MSISVISVIILVSFDRELNLGLNYRMECLDCDLRKKYQIQTVEKEKVFLKLPAPFNQTSTVLPQVVARNFSWIHPEVISENGFVKCTEKMNMKIKAKKHPPIEMINSEQFKDILRDKVGENGVIIIVTVDYSYTDMALNLFETSFLRFNIPNYIFVCSHPLATRTLLAYNITAVTLWNDQAGVKASEFQSQTFRQKARYKTMAASVVLEMGYSVLLMDVDIVFLKNPFPYLRCNSCDIIIQAESGFFTRNSGFYMAFPTTMAKKLHFLMLKSYNLSPEFSDQPCMNGLMNILEEQDGFKVEILDQEQFQNGERYFDKGKRMFASDNPCKDCIIVHNNNILYHANKVYRFKEHLFWMLDQNGYYSNPGTTYIMYGNPLDFDTDTRQMEDIALKNAILLGELLGRIVILPKFYCFLCPYTYCTEVERSGECNAQAHYDMTILDSITLGKYREHVFLKHPKVPLKIKNSISKPLLIRTKISNQESVMEQMNFTEVHHVFMSRNFPLAPTRTELKRWLKEFDHFPVIKFHSLYGDIINSNRTIEILSQLTLALKNVRT